MAKKFIYENVEILEVIDGDTLKIKIDFGFNTFHIDNLRLYGCNAPEIGTDDGKKAKQFVEDWLKDKKITVETAKSGKDKYGRYLAKVLVDSISLTDILISNNFAVVFEA